MSLTILDGSIGQELVNRSSEEPTGLWSTEILIRNPDLVREVHADYFAVGADIATTNSYAVHRDRMVRHNIEDQFEKLLNAAGRIAVEARDAHGNGRVAGSIGPAGWSYRPSMAPPEEEGAEIYAEIARVLATYVDVLLFETMSSVKEAKSALMGAAAVNKATWLSVTVSDDDGTRFRSGDALQDIVPVVNEFKPDALLINCSVPEAVSVALSELSNADLGGIPIGAYANGFTRISDEFVTENKPTVSTLEARTDLNPDKYADFVGNWIETGAEIVGGCCEVGPDHIREITRRFTN